jgi:hypothetical protein
MRHVWHKLLFFFNLIIPSGISPTPGTAMLYGDTTDMLFGDGTNMEFGG